MLTKADLCDDIPARVEQLRAVDRKIDIIPVSALTGYGMDRLRAYAQPGKTIVLLGSSGAGKSTLVNTLAGQELMKVSAIRAGDDKGRHTTTHRRMVTVGGVNYIDTPGVRELGMCDVEEGIGETFPDIAELEGRCRFRDCSHRSEPGCAVRAALEDGSLSAQCWELFQAMRRESRIAAGMKKPRGSARGRNGR